MENGGPGNPSLFEVVGAGRGGESRSGGRAWTRPGPEFPHGSWGQKVARALEGSVSRRWAGQRGGEVCPCIRWNQVMFYLKFLLDLTPAYILLSFNSVTKEICCLF